MTTTDPAHAKAAERIERNLTNPAHHWTRQQDLVQDLLRFFNLLIVHRPNPSTSLPINLASS